MFKLHKVVVFGVVLLLKQQASDGKLLASFESETISSRYCCRCASSFCELMNQVIIIINYKYYNNDTFPVIRGFLF